MGFYANHREKPEQDLGILGAASLGESGLLLTPFIVGAIIKQYGYSEAYSGAMISIQLASMAVSSLLLTIWIGGVSPKRLAIVAVLVDIIGYLLTCFNSDGNVLVFARVMTGGAEGVLWSVANITASKSRNTIRIFSRIMIVVGIFAIILPYSVLQLSYLIDHLAVFAVLAIFCIILLPSLFFLPARLPESTSANIDQSGRRLSIKGLFALLALSTFIMGQLSVWIYLELIGHNAGVDSAHIMLAVSISYILGLLGAYGSMYWGSKLRKSQIFLFGLIGAVGAALLTSYATNVFAFWLGVFGINIFYMFLMPHYKDLIAWADPTGRCATAAAAFFSLGIIGGPSVASLIIGMGYVYSVLGWLATGFFGISAVMLLLAKHTEQLQRYT